MIVDISVSVVERLNRPIEHTKNAITRILPYVTNSLSLSD
jgi:hypothetical protein